MDNTQNKNVLVLFSGGKDSFLTAIHFANKRYHVTLLSCNSGSIAGEHVFGHSAKRLENRYKGQIAFAGIYNTAAILQRMNRHRNTASYAELGRKYGSAANGQMACMLCQSSMWAAAIAYAKAHDIGTIAAGYKQSDVFCTGMVWFQTAMEGYAHNYGIEVQFPLWDRWSISDEDMLKEAIERHMMENGFLPQVYEPKCMTGMPVPEPGRQTVTSMENYFTDWVHQEMKPAIENLIPIFQTMPLNKNHSLEVLDYNVPDGSDGYY